MLFARMRESQKLYAVNQLDARNSELHKIEQTGTETGKFVAIYKCDG